MFVFTAIIFIGSSIAVIPEALFSHPLAWFVGILQLKISVSVIPSQDIGFRGFGSYTGSIFASVPTHSLNSALWDKTYAEV